MSERLRELSGTIHASERKRVPPGKPAGPVGVRSILALQRVVGNAAVAGLAERGQLDRWNPVLVLQRDNPDAGVATASPSQTKASLGWDEEGANKAGAELVNGMMRHALKGLPAPIDQAIVIVPPILKKQLETTPDLKVDFLVHLHGYGIGWHGRTEALEKAAGRKLPSVIGENEARDKALDHLEEQLAIVSKDRPIVAILPQGHGYQSGFGGKGFDRVDLVNNVRKAMADVGRSMPAVGGVILSGHSGAGGTFAQVLGKEEDAKAKGQHLEELVLFDAINGTSELRAVTGWINARLQEDYKELVDLKGKGEDAQKLHLSSSTRFRGYCTHNVPNRELSDARYVDFFLNPKRKFKFQSVQQTIDGWFKRTDVKALGANVVERWKANYAVTDVEAKGSVGHEEMMGDKSRFVEALKR